MNKTTDYFDTICLITHAIGTTSKYEDLLDLVVTSAVEAMDGKGASLFLANEDNEYFVSVANAGLSENYKHANPVRVKPVIDTVLKEGGHLSVQDATTDSRIPNHQAKKDEGIASLLSVPVMVKEDITGVLTLYTADPRDFSKKEIKLLKALANQGGLAIERSKLINGILTSARLFKKISERINSSLEIKNILSALSCDIRESLELHGVVIRLKDEETDELKLVATCGMSQAFLDKGPIYTDKGFAKVMNGESLIYDDFESESSLIQYPDALKNEGIQSLLSVPVKTKNTVIGVMNLYSTAKTKFNKGMVEMAEALAIQGGIAIQNASLYLKLNETKESLEKDIWGYRSWF